MFDASQIPGVSQAPHLGSQQVRAQSFEGDALRLSMDWSVEDLGRSQILVETAAGQSHPSSYHLGSLGDEAVKGVFQAGGKPAEYTTTDICDGVAQAHAGMQYPLVTRELIADMVEAHVLATPFDGLVLSSAGDKAVPAHLMAMARLGLPAVHIPGGAMASGPAHRSNEELWSMNVQLTEGKIDLDEFLAFQRFACPGCGACQYMGTASTMQVMSEALGCALPWSALVPTGLAEIRRMARSSGERVVRLVDEGIGMRDILTRESFENAITVHAAIGGSLNAVMHLIAIAAEAGIALEAADFDRIHRDTPVLVDAKTAGRYPTELFWYAGGVPRVMAEIREHLHLNALTVSGGTIGQNIDRITGTQYQRHAAMFLGNYRVNRTDIIRERDNPVYTTGSTALLSGNLSDGATVKSHAVAETMMHHIGPARVYNREEDAVADVINGTVTEGDIVVVRYQGPKAAGMPEMFFLSELIASSPTLAFTTALITDGRFSGASRGPCIGYANPEALIGGPLAFVETGDVIEINIPERSMNLIQTFAGATGEALDAELALRRMQWSPPDISHGGALGRFTRLVAPALKGAVTSRPVTPQTSAHT